MQMKMFKNRLEKGLKKDLTSVTCSTYPTVKHNRKILDKLPRKTCTINAINEITADCKYPATLISLAQNKKQYETDGLAKCLKLKIGAKVMVAVNVDIQDMLINGQIEEVAGFEIMNSIVKNFFSSFRIL